MRGHYSIQGELEPLSGEDKKKSIKKKCKIHGKVANRHNYVQAYSCAANPILIYTLLDPNLIKNGHTNNYFKDFVKESKIFCIV